MIIIYPSDPSTKFLNEICTKVTKLVNLEVTTAMPNQYKETINYLKSKKEPQTILFLGHGTPSGLYGGCYVPHGRKILISKEMAKEVFKNKNVILFACKSSELIRDIPETFNVAIGFGNIKTGREDLTSQREKKKYRDPNSLRIFRKKLTTLFANALAESIQLNYNFDQFYNATKLRINKSICTLSLSKEPNDRLAGELMFEIKKEMIIIGNINSKLL